MRMFARNDQAESVSRGLVEAWTMLPKRHNGSLGLLILAATFGVIFVVRPTYEAVITLQARNGIICRLLDPNLSPRELAEIGAKNRAEYEAFVAAHAC